jgi:hypothetical protein
MYPLLVVNVSFIVVILQTPLQCPQFRKASLITFARLYFHPEGWEVGVMVAEARKYVRCFLQSPY